jgi:hypothetical protein
MPSNRRSGLPRRAGSVRTNEHHWRSSHFNGSGTSLYLTDDHSPLPAAMDRRRASNGPRLGVNNSGGRRLAGAARERLEFISVAVSSMRRSPPQVGVLTTRRARHTIIYPERASLGSRYRREPLRRPRASTAFTEFGRGIFIGVLSILTAHFRFLEREAPIRCRSRRPTKARYGPPRSRCTEFVQRTNMH